MIEDILKETIGPVWTLLYLFFVVFIPFTLGKKFLARWSQYARAKYFAKQKYTVLELRIPKNMLKSPLAMELILNMLHQGGNDTTWKSRYFAGSVRPWFSLELCSIEGAVHFYLWTKQQYKDLIENQLYSQYPDIEIIDQGERDYTRAIPFDPKEYEYWGCEFKKTAASHIPIKTYIDFGLDKDPEEEVKIDPITSVIEFLGSLKHGEQVWMQIGVRAHGKDVPNKDAPGGYVDWKHDAQKDLLKRTKRDVELKEGKQENPNKLQLTKGEKEVVDAIERSISKLPFDCGIRTIYIAKKNVFRTSVLAGITNSFKQYNASHLNGFAPDKVPGSDIKYKWQDRTGSKILNQKKKLFNQYRNRSFFYSDFIPVGHTSKPFVLNIEELATIYHFPGDVSKTPTLYRVSAKKSEPPTNLPI